MRSEPEYLAKYFEGRGLTEKVMGNADYHPSPVVLICPFDSCKKSHRVLNGVSAVSQLYSHWKGRHASNPMAIVLEKRKPIPAALVAKMREMYGRARAGKILSDFRGIVGEAADKSGD